MEICLGNFQIRSVHCRILLANELNRFSAREGFGVNPEPFGAENKLAEEKVAEKHRVSLLQAVNSDASRRLEHGIYRRE